MLTGAAAGDACTTATAISSQRAAERATPERAASRIVLSCVISFPLPNTPPRATGGFPFRQTRKRLVRGNYTMQQRFDGHLRFADGAQSRELGEARGDLGDVTYARRAFGQVANEPAPRRGLELRRPSFRVEMDELQCVPERQVRELACRIFGHPQRSTLDGAPE